MNVNTREDKAFEKDVLSPCLIRLSVDKKCESMFKKHLWFAHRGRGR